MNVQDAETVVAIASLAALADGKQSDVERTHITGAAGRLGVKVESALVEDALNGRIGLEALVETRIRQLASGNTVNSLLAGLRA